MEKKKKNQNIISEGKKNFLGKKAYIKMINLKKKKCHLQQYGWIERLPY